MNDTFPDRSAFARLSRMIPGDLAEISVSNNGRLRGTIAAVKFTIYGKVFYDVSVELDDGAILLREIDSVVVSPVTAEAVV